MSLFRRSTAVKTDPQEVERWRGRAAEILDAGALPWEVVFSSLKIAPEADPRADLELPALVMAPLGLEWIEVHDRGFSGGTLDGDPINLRETNIYYGQRYGRPVLMNQGNQRTGNKGAYVCWVNASTPTISLVGRGGRLEVDSPLSPEVSELVAGISEQPKLWKDVHLVGGPEGIVVKRPVKSLGHPQGWIYDLWLAEQVAHLSEYATLPAPDPRATYLPYQLDRTHTW